MAQITVETCHIDGVKIITPRVFPDSRGYFFESYNASEIAASGVGLTFVQDNESMSARGVLRGLHFQKEHPQGKLIRVISGAVYDVGVDIRSGSATFGQYFGLELSGENKKQLYLPPGFAHGYYVLSDMAIFAYKCTDYYAPGDEGGIIWNDPAIGIDWPIAGSEPMLAEKDRLWPALIKLR
jgi:dTDP-4-dehydrorhamnose 3,5-epimerase